MSASAERFPYVQRDPTRSESSLAPMLPLTLRARGSATLAGLVDSGAAINVIPFSVGTQLGLDWNQQTDSVKLSGNLAAVESRIVVVMAEVASFPPVQLAFAWAQSDAIPMILGQVNFFLEFDVCFYRSRAIFEVRPKGGA